MVKKGQIVLSPGPGIPPPRTQTRGAFLADDALGIADPERNPDDGNKKRGGDHGNDSDASSGFANFPDPSEFDTLGENDDDDVGQLMGSIITTGGTGQVRHGSHGIHESDHCCSCSPMRCLWMQILVALFPNPTFFHP